MPSGTSCRLSAIGQSVMLKELYSVNFALNTLLSLSHCRQCYYGLLDHVMDKIKDSEYNMRHIKRFLMCALLRIFI